MMSLLTRRRLARSLTVLGLIAAVWWIVTWTSGAFVNGRLCVSSCHQMRPYAEAAEDRAHSGVTCGQCHGAVGPLGAAADGLALQRRALAAATGAQPRGSGAPQASCLSCHAGVTKGTLVANGIAVRHSDFASLSCSSCHTGVAHRLRGRVYRAVDMDVCMGCHSASAFEPEGCSLCHVPTQDGTRSQGATTWRSTHGARWRQTHGLGELKLCITCHTPRDCAGCHLVAVPHPAAWAGSHGDGLRDAAQRGCRTCHTAGWCDGCHGVAMPHGSGFLKSHGEVATRAQPGTCERCHLPAACTECHLRSAHPDVPGIADSHGGAP